MLDRSAALHGRGGEEIGMGMMGLGQTAGNYDTLKSQESMFADSKKMWGI
jgi:hypothetical protein